MAPLTCVTPSPPLRDLRLTDRGQTITAERIRARPGTRGVDHRSSGDALSVGLEANAGGLSNAELDAANAIVTMQHTEILTGAHEAAMRGAESLARRARGLAPVDEAAADFVAPGSWP